MVDHWTRESSDLYRRLAVIAVPARAEQIATLLTLFPFGKDESFRAVELASGEGRLSYAILEAFPMASVLALDYEPSMQAETAFRLRHFGERAAVDTFDMTQSDWYDKLNGADAVVSSLCIHHLNAAQKRALFAAVQNKLSPQGVFVIADLIMPKRPQSRELFAATWDKSAEIASYKLTRSRELYELFLVAGWNYFRYPAEYDKPSPLSDQLLWLTDAGFVDVDCFWMQAGHAIYGGYGRAAGGERLTYGEALEAAGKALR